MISDESLRQWKISIILYGKPVYHSRPFVVFFALL